MTAWLYFHVVDDCKIDAGLLTRLFRLRSITRVSLTCLAQVNIVLLFCLASMFFRVLRWAEKCRTEVPFLHLNAKYKSGEWGTCCGKVCMLLWGFCGRA